VTDRDDALRRELGWSGPAASNFEPEPARIDPATEPSAPQPDGVADDSDSPTGDVGPRSAPPAAGPYGVGPPQPRYSAAPPASFRESRRYPGGNWPDPAAWPARPNPQPTRPPVAPAPPAQQWQGGQGWPEFRFAPPQAPADWSYAEGIDYTELVPQRRTPPGRGWRKLLYQATFGLVNLGPSPDERRQAELEGKIRAVLRGHYKIGVLGKGGVGKTTVSASVGSVFAELRQEDRVVAVDADTAFGKLGSRIDPRAPGSYWELTGDDHLDSFADIRSRVGNNAAGLFVLAGESTPARRRVLDPAVYREATARLDRYFSISIIDCSSTMDSPVTQEVLRDLDGLIVVSSPWVDGAAAAGQTMDWLANRGLSGLLQRTVVVLNDSDGHADKRTRSILSRQFGGHGQVVIEVPFDGHLRPGGVIDGTSEMSVLTRRRFLEIAAALAEHFPTSDDRLRDRR